MKGTVPDSSSDAQRAQSVVEPTMEPVIQSCSHDEPPASRDTQLLQELADLDWAENIENRIRDASATHERSELAQPSDKVHLISFRSGQGEQFRDMLLQG